MGTVSITVFCIIITVAIYLVSLKLFKKFPSPFTMPVFLSTILIILVLLLANLSYEDYMIAKELMTFFLGPATVALAVPLYRQRHILFKLFLPVLAGIFGGTLITMIVAVYLAVWLGLSTNMILSFSIKSVTIPIASEVAPIIGADPLLVMMFVMITGMSGAMFGTYILNFGRVHHPLARGLSYGTISHGIGTSQAVKESEIAGASSSVAMGLAAMITSFIVPWLLPLLF